MSIKPKCGNIRALLKQRASTPVGCCFNDFPELTPRQVLENARKMPDLYVVGYRHQARLFADPAHAAHYRDVALPAIKAEIKRNKRRADWLREKAEREPKPAKAKAEKPPKAAKPPKQPAVKSVPAKVVGVSIPKYTGPKFDKNTPVDYSRAKLTICPSPKAFGPAAKLLGIGA